MEFRKGLTLVELLATVAILTTLSAITLPVVASARESANKTSCTAHLRQLAALVEIYRSDEGGDGTEGPMYAMGLPPDPVPATLLNLDFSPKHPEHIGTCHGAGRPPQSVAWGFHYYYMPRLPQTDKPDVWAQYVGREGENAVLFVDPNHNPPFTAITADGTTKFCLGVRLDGHITRVRGTGNPLELAFWGRP